MSGQGQQQELHQNAPLRSQDVLSSFEIRYIRFFLSCGTARHSEEPRSSLISPGEDVSTTAARLEEEILDICAIHARELRHLLT